MKRKILNGCVCVVIVAGLFTASHWGWTPLSAYDKGVSTEEQQSARRLEQTVTVLARQIGSRSYQQPIQLKAGADYIAREFAALGYTVQRQVFEARGQQFENVIAHHGDSQSNDIVVIGAHYDTWHNPGADDNASGVAGVLELARLLKDTQLDVDIHFAAFANEEPPFFHTPGMGSWVYAKALKQGDRTVRAAMSLEMLGYYSEQWFSQRYLPLIGFFFPNKANFIAIVGNAESRELTRDVYRSFKRSRRFPVERIVAPERLPGIGFSDHWSFWQEDIPAVMVTDTAFMRNPHYHKTTDLPGTLDYFKMAKVVHGLHRVIQDMFGR